RARCTPCTTRGPAPPRRWAGSPADATVRETGRVDARDVRRIAAVLDSTVVSVRTLAGGFSHETCLLTMTDGQVVGRLGGADPPIGAAVRDVGRRYVPVPEVLALLPDAMVLAYVPGATL